MIYTEYEQVIPVGTLVKVLTHRHPDVHIGTVGRVDGHYEGGVCVAITGSWQIAGHDRGGVKHGTEVCWYPVEEVDTLNLGEALKAYTNGHS